MKFSLSAAVDTIGEVKVVVDRLLPMLMAAVDMAIGRVVPKLVGSGVELRHRVGEIDISMPDLCAQRGHAEIDELCIWRVAELKQSGVDPGAKPRVSWAVSGGKAYLTCSVERSDGTIEGQQFLEKLLKG